MASHESKAAAAYIRQRRSDTDALIKKNRITAAEGAMLNRRLDALADEIEQGLHL